MRHSGFSLVELSIVLVILGLLVGGILAGQSLIRASELRSVGTDYARFNTAIAAFRDKYRNLPGDMPNATAFWGALDPTAATCITLPSNGTTATCNGDGDGTLQYPGILYLTPENHRLWQHLANAGLIDGKYTGIGNDTPISYEGSMAGVNTPKLKLNNAIFQARWVQSYTGHATMWDGPYGNLFYFGAKGPALADNPHQPVLRGEEAWNLDKKLDDGSPAYGRILTVRYNAASSWAVPMNQCATTALPNTAEYAVALPGLVCGLIFRWQ
jgi:prepilin-type N-terminal cleavage/methylation domain-containing protein